MRSQSQDTAPFQVETTQRTLDINQRSIQEIRLTIKNTKNEELYFAVLILSSGFHVKQLFPANDALESLPAGDTKSFPFFLSVADKLLRSVEDQNHTYREIVRTVVIRGKSVSLKSMELSSIWAIGEGPDQQQNGPDRGGDGGGRLLEDVSWWIHDTEWTTCDQGSTWVSQNA
jgi:hypothetical protein